jgi:hypothetical protein
MKTLQNRTKATWILALFLTTSLQADKIVEKKLSYGDIQSKILENERSFLTNKRNHLAQKVTKKSDTMYVSNLLDTIRESSRAKR